MPPADRRATLPTHWPGLDGLRAVAVLLVFAFHSPFGHASLEGGWQQGGFIGVDIFFVLSGLLITLILLRQPPLIGFYARRVLRLMPALLALVVVSATYAVLVLGPVARHNTLSVVAPVLVYSFNWTEAFRPAPAPGLLSHTWSLAVEFQFYLLWPLVMLGMRRLRFDPRTMLIATVLGIELCSAWRAVLYAGGAQFERTYFGLDTRLDSLLVGCGLALVLSWRGLPRTHMGEAYARVLGLTSTLFLVGVVLFIPRDDPFLYERGGMTMVALAAAVVIYNVVAVPSGAFATVLGWRPLVWLGRLSYSIFLWHWPVFFLTQPEKTGMTFAQAMAVRVVLTLALSAASHYLVERPFLALRGRTPARRTPAPRLRLADEAAPRVAA